jgi:membrane protein DedA with SNARE-associated domain
MAAPPAAVESPADTAPKAARRGILVAAAVLYATGTFGSNIAPAWIEERPEIVLALSSRNRNLLLAVPNTDVIAYAVIGFLRLFVVGIVLYYVGAWFGARFLAWTEKQVGELPAVYRWFQTGIDRAGWAFVLVMPGSNLVCMMAGHRRMSMRLFAPLLAIGIVLKLIVIRLAGDQFREELEKVLDFIGKYQWWLVGGLFALSFLQSGRKMKKGALPLPTDDPLD